MALVTKEFGWSDTAQTPYTKSLIFRDNNKPNCVYFLFFEWISPIIEKPEFLQIIQYSFKKFYSQPKFTLGLKSFASYLLVALKEQALEEVDINFVIGKVTSKYVRLTKFGQADIYMYKSGHIADLDSAAPSNLDLNALNYVKLPFEQGSLLFITNFGLFTSLIDNGMVQLTNKVQLLKDLDTLKQDILESKTILMIADLDPNLDFQLHLQNNRQTQVNNLQTQQDLSKKSGNVLENANDINMDKQIHSTFDSKEVGDQKLLKDIQNAQANQSGSKFLGGPKAENGLNSTQQDDVTRGVTSMHKVGLQELEKDLRRLVKNTEELFVWMASGVSRFLNKTKITGQKVVYKTMPIVKQSLNFVSNNVRKVVKKPRSIQNDSVTAYAQDHSDNVPNNAVMDVVIADNFTSGNVISSTVTSDQLSEDVQGYAHAKTLDYVSKNGQSKNERPKNKQLENEQNVQYVQNPKLQQRLGQDLVQEERMSSGISGQAANQTLNKMSHPTSKPTDSMDAVKYFRLRRSFTGKVYIGLMKIGNYVQRLIAKIILQIGFIKHTKHRTVGIVGAKLGQGPSPVSKKTDLKKFLFIFIGIIIVFVALGQIKKAYTLKKKDVSCLQQAKSVVTDLTSYYSELKNTPSEQDADHFNKCFTKIEQAQGKLNNLKQTIHFASNRKILDSLLDSVNNTNQECHNLYRQVFNVKSIKDSDINVLKDFKTAFGDQSDVKGVAVYKGILVVTDYGRGVVYQVNPENGKVTKLKDPKTLVKQPYSIGFGENTDGAPLIFVCDHQSGVLYYVSGYGFKQIPGTDAVALGSKCMQVGGFGTNAYFTTEKGTYLYKATRLGGSYAFPKAYITVKNSGKVLDFAIDGSIYALLQYPNVDKIEQGSKKVYSYDIEKYFGGRPDRFSLSQADSKRLSTPELLYTNPSGYKPLYVYDPKNKYIFEVEKPTSKKHPGIGIFVKTLDISSINNGAIQDFAVDLSVNNNKEQFLYIITDGKLLKIKNP